MTTPLEEVVGQNYRHFVRFILAAGAIIGLVILTGERARAFVDDRIDTKSKVMDASVISQGRRIERMEGQLDEVRANVIEIKAEVSTIKAILEKQER